MPIDLSTDAAKLQYHNMVLRVLSRLEGTINRQLKPMFNRTYMDAASLVTHGVKDVDHVVNEQTARLRKILREHYRRVALTAGRNATRAFDPAKSMGASFWNEVNTFTTLNIGQKIKQINNTSVEMLSTVIGNGVKEGMTNAEIATSLRKIGKIDSRFRSIRIARTETLGMYNSATEASITDTGLKFDRIWSTTRDLRTRRRKRKMKWSKYDHWVVNGQKRKQNEPFNVSGENLRYPGDPNGSAGNIIQCRCILMYERVREGLRR